MWGYRFSNKNLLNDCVSIKNTKIKTCFYFLYILWKRGQRTFLRMVVWTFSHVALKSSIHFLSLNEPCAITGTWWIGPAASHIQHCDNLSQLLHLIALFLFKHNLFSSNLVSKSRISSSLYITHIQLIAESSRSESSNRNLMQATIKLKKVNHCLKKGK